MDQIRAYHSASRLTDGAASIAGGRHDVVDYLNDVWRTVDGINWIQLSAGAPWHTRQYHTAVVLSTGAAVLMGGYSRAENFNDVWRSNNGST